MKKNFFKLCIVVLLVAFTQNACKPDEPVPEPKPDNKEQTDSVVVPDNNGGGENQQDTVPVPEPDPEPEPEPEPLPPIYGQWLSEDGTILLDIRTMHGDSVVMASISNDSIKRIYQYPFDGCDDSVAMSGSFVTKATVDELANEYGCIRMHYEAEMFNWSDLGEESVVINEVRYVRQVEPITIPAWYSLFKKWKATGDVDYSGRTITATANFDFVTYPKDVDSDIRQFFCKASGKIGFTLTPPNMGPWPMTINYAANTRLAGDIKVSNCDYSYTIPLINKTISFNELNCVFSDLQEKTVYLETRMFNREFNQIATVVQ